MRGSSIRENYREILFVFTAFFAMAVVSYSYLRDIVTAQLKVNGEEVMTSASSMIFSRLVESEIYLVNASFAARVCIETGGSQREIVALFTQLSDILERPQDTITAFNGVYGYLRGDYMDGGGWVPPDDYIPPTRPWYEGARNASGETYFTEPYIDADTGRMIFSASREVFGDRGVSYGVIAIDVDITALTEYVKKLSVLKFGYGVLVNANGEIVTHRNDDLIGRGLGSINTGYAEIESMLDRGEGISALEFRDENGIASVAFMTELFNGWHLGVITQQSVYFDKLYEMAVILTILGGVLSVGLSFFLVNISDAKRLSDERSESKSTFLAKMSHEIRTPMNAIVGMSELIVREREKLPAKIYEHALGIKHASANLLSIINDILDFSKIESGKMQIVRGEYAFPSILNDVVNIIRMRIQEKAVMFFVNIDSSIPTNMVGDEVRIRQIFLNLLSNAAKYTNEGYIALDVRCTIVTDGRLVLTIEVSDTGIGIKEEDIPKLFGDFVQIDQVKNKGIEGTGLGLPITKSLSIAMGGDTTVSSVYGVGSVFTVTIPQRFREYARVASVQGAEAKSVLVYETREVYARSISATLSNLGVSHSVVAGQSKFLEAISANRYDYFFVSTFVFESARNIVERLGLGGEIIVSAEIGEVISDLSVRSVVMPVHALSMATILNDGREFHASVEDYEPGIRFAAPSARVLIVDDIATNLSVAHGLIAPYGIQVDTCRSGEEAIELVRTNSYDIVFMDHMMPDMDGIEATELIRKIEGGRYRNLPIVALTANVMSGMREMFIERGLSDFLPKPIETKRLTAVLERWIPPEKIIRGQLPGAAPAAEERGFDIDGVDVSSGIAMMGGSLDQYLTVLSVFLGEGHAKIKEIRFAAGEGDLKRYTTHVHALKSAAATIGAAHLSDFARSLEVAGKKRDTSLIDSATENFLDEYAALLRRIEEALGTGDSRPGAPTEIGDMSMLRENLSMLREALERYDAGAADRILHTVGAYKWDSKVTRGIETISQCILLFEYESAVSVIDSLLK